MNERRDRLKRELEHLTKTFKAGIMTEKEYKKGKDRIEQKLAEIDEQQSRDDKSKEIISNILDDKENEEKSAKSDEKEDEEAPYEKVIYSEELDEDEDSAEDDEADKESKEDSKKAEEKKKSTKSAKKKTAKKKPASTKPKSKEKRSSNLSTYLIIIAIIVVILYTYRDSLSITGAAVKAPTTVTINSSDIIDMDVYMDYSCRYADDVQENLKLLKIAYIDNLNINYRFLPLDEASVGPMIALACAERQNVFWRYHMLLADESNNAISNGRLVEIFSAMSSDEDLNLDIDAFTNCVENEETKDRIITDMESAADLGIETTPTFVIDGDLFIGFRNADELSKILNERLS